MPTRTLMPIQLLCCCAAFCLLAALPASAAEPPLAKLLVDFENQDAVKLTGSKAQSSPLKVDAGTALEIATAGDADYPNVRIQPTSGNWDLSGFETVTAEIHNPQDRAVRVLLSVNNPKANGQNHCSVASATIGAGERGLVTVPLGKWHGEVRPLDLANVASIDVLLDHPGRPQKFVVDNIKAARQERFDPRQAQANPFFQSLKPPFGRGINLGNALEAPNEGEWGVTLEDDYFAAIAKAGFDSIRLPVRWSAHAQHTAPYTIDPKFMARVDWAVEQALSRKLKVVMNIHHYAEMDSQPDEHRERFLALWQQIADHYRDRPSGLAFELLNEPHNKLTAGKWNTILAEALTVVRKTNPERTVVVGPVAWNSIGELKSLELPESDRHLVVTVHYYSPFKFTHQGAHWIDAKTRPPVGTRWTGDEAEREAVARDLDTAALWGLKHRRPIYLGEFGAFNAADLASRARWTEFVAHEAAKRRMGTAYWEFCSGFGAYDPVKNAWIEPLRAALLPQGEK